MQCDYTQDIAFVVVYVKQFKDINIDHLDA